MKKLLLALFVFALVSGIALANEVIGSASNIQGIGWVQHKNTGSKVRLAEGMQLLDDGQIFLEKNSSLKANSAFGAPTVTINYGDTRYRIPGCGQGNEKSPGARLVLLPCCFLCKLFLIMAQEEEGGS